MNESVNTLPQPSKARPTQQQIAKWRSQPRKPQKTATITRTSLPAYQHLYMLSYRKKILHTLTVAEFAAGHAIIALHTQAKAKGFTHVKQGKHTRTLKGRP